jgi:hypothetical protein
MNVAALVLEYVNTGLPSTFHTMVLGRFAASVMFAVKFTDAYWHSVVGPPAASTIVNAGDATYGFIIICLFLTGPDTPQMLTPTTLIAVGNVPAVLPQLTYMESLP